MKKRLLITITVILVLAVGAGILAGCTESLKQKPIATEYGSAVSGNGGMTVVYGNYLYFINGYAAESDSNVFGEVVKGSIARVALKDGVPDGEAQIVVPKKVYGTDSNYGGISIVNDYIYYTTTSTERDGDGNPKTSQSVIMRTKVDGTDTKELVKLDSHGAVIKVVDTKLVYIYNSTIYSVDLGNKKFPVTTVEESISSGYQFTDEYVFYVVNKDGNSSNQEIKVYPLAGGQPKTVINNEIYEKSDIQYTFSLINAIDEGSSVKVFFAKTDDTVGKPEQGIYAVDLAKESFAFVKTNEKQFTYNSNSTTNLAYTKFYKAGGYYLGFASSKLDAFNADGTKVEKDGKVQGFNVSNNFTVFEIAESADGVYLWYLDSGSVLRKIKIMSKVGDKFEFVDANETKIFSGKVNTSYVGMEKVGNVIYYLNSDVSNNAYYYVIDEENPADGKEKILGILTDTDIIAAF